MELERQDNILIIGHQVRVFSPNQDTFLILMCQAILRCLFVNEPLGFQALLMVLLRYAYFHNLTQADLPYIKIPLHTVIKLTPKAYGCDEERYLPYTDILASVMLNDIRYALPIGAVDTHRPKPGTLPENHLSEPNRSSAREYFTGNN